MATYLFTNTTYGTWLPGDSRGSVTSVRNRREYDLPGTTRIRHNQFGEKPEVEMLNLRRSAELAMKGAPIALTESHARILEKQFHETCEHRKWTLFAFAIMWNHFHLVAEIGEAAPKPSLSTLKAYGTRALNREFGRPASETWWTENGSKRKLDRDEQVFAAIRYVLQEQPNPLVSWGAKSFLGGGDV